MREIADIVVVGAGIGGLVAAAELAHAGRDVVVLESAAGPGGKIRQVDSLAGPVDAGPTVLTMPEVFRQLFAECGAEMDDHVRLDRLDVLARHVWPDGETLDLHADAETSAAAIRAFAGLRGEREFRAFTDKAARLFSAFEGPMMQAPKPDRAAAMRQVMRDPRLMGAMAPGLTLAADLARQFSDRRLAQLFGRYSTYVGGLPHRTPALMALIWQAEAAGVWRVDGGISALARAVAELARAGGAELRFATGVAGLTVEDGRVAGVTLADGGRIAARSVVFNGDPRALANGLLGDGALGAAPGVVRADRSLSANVWAFAAAPKGVDLAHHTVFFPDNDSEFADLEAGRLPRAPTLYVCAQDRGGASPPPPLERFEIIMNAAPLTQTHRDDIEEAACRRQTFRTLQGHGLTFTPEPTDAALTTPWDFAALHPGSAGALYGQSPHGLFAPFARPTARSGLAGLYLAGGGVHPGPGVPMAARSGRHAAAAILADPASMSPSRRTAMPGGTSTG